MTTADFLPLGCHRLDSGPERDSIRHLLRSLWTDLVWTVERAVSVELHRRRNEPEDERRELSYLSGDIDDALQYLARLIELLVLGHAIDWHKFGPSGNAPPYFVRGGGAIRAHEIQTLGEHPRDPAPSDDSIRFLLNSGKERLVRLDEDTTTYRRIRYTGGAEADALAQRMSETAQGASAALARVIELLFLGHRIDFSKSGPGTEQLRAFKAKNEADWFVAQHPSTLCKMLRPLDYGVSVRFPGRKWQFFSLACVRRILHVFQDERTLGLIEVAEQYADGAIRSEEFDRLRREANEPPNRDRAQDAASHSKSGYQALHSAYVGNVQSAMHAAGEARAAVDDPDTEVAAQIALVREVFGNPYRVEAPDPNWLSWDAGTIEILARGIYEGRAFDRMPILGDALEDAGCTNIDILEHCRGPNEHVRGCWVLDLLLGNHLAAQSEQGITT